MLSAVWQFCSYLFWPQRRPYVLIDKINSTAPHCVYGMQGGVVVLRLIVDRKFSTSLVGVEN